MKALLFTGFLLALAARAAAQATAPTFRTEIIETTPLPGVDLPLDAIPAPVQTAAERDILNTGAVDLPDFLNRRLANVFINEIAGNPFQPDVNYRGYTASPLLGTPQGLSVYMDGVRLNQPFGDVVSWDLIPRVAIASTTLMPGSNPLFGLNTLGGALAVQTKDGRGHPGTSMQVTGGGYGRRAVEFEHGQTAANGVNWYLAGNLFHDSGWRASSPSDVRQIFTKVGWQDSKTELHVTGAYADNALTGNGLQELRLLAADYASVHDAGHHEQPCGLRQPDGETQPVESDEHVRQRVLSRHQDEHAERRPQRELARSERTPPVKAHRLRRFPSHAVCSRYRRATSPERSATGCSIARARRRTTTACQGS